VGRAEVQLGQLRGGDWAVLDVPAGDGSAGRECVLRLEVLSAGKVAWIEGETGVDDHYAGGELLLGGPTGTDLVMIVYAQPALHDPAVGSRPRADTTSTAPRRP